jgi:hypothetical protein
MKIAALLLALATLGSVNAQVAFPPAIPPDPSATTAAADTAFLANGGGAPASTPLEQARFLSGLRLPAGSVLEPFQHSPEYLDHTRAYATAWKKFDQRYFGPMRAFAAHTLAPRIGSPQALYYLFSGPDFINAYALFPDVPVYILVGLESPGSIVPPERLDPARLKLGLDNLRKATLVTLQFSFFITKDMKLDLEQTDFKGVLPIIESFIALGGGTITSVRPFSPGGGLPGIEIRFQKTGAPEQIVYYIRADLANDGGNGALFKWMAQFRPAVAYLKAASYLLHEPYFSRSRDFLLTHTTAILQDDSGIPLRYYLQSGPWQISFFGHYNGTLDLFKKYYQPDLAAAYQQTGALPLDFGTGYKWRQGESNLLLVTRQAGAPKAQPVAPTAQPIQSNVQPVAPGAQPAVPRTHAVTVPQPATTPPLVIGDPGF